MKSCALWQVLDKAILLEQDGAYEAAEGMFLDTLDRATQENSFDLQVLCFGHLILFLQRRGRCSVVMERLFSVLLDLEDRSKEQE